MRREWTGHLSGPPRDAQARRVRRCRGRDRPRRDARRPRAGRGADAQARRHLQIPGFDPPHFDPYQTPHWWTFINLSLTHSRLLKVKAGPAVPPGTLPIEPDLAESWTRPDDTTWVFSLKKGVRWHNKPPVQRPGAHRRGREVHLRSGDDGRRQPEPLCRRRIERVEAVDRYTVKFTTKVPYAWFLDVPAQLFIIPREAVEKFGDLKKPETVIGTGPWMLERYDPNVRCTYVRNPAYFVAGLPYADGVEITIDPDPASKLAAWLAGKYDFAPELGMVVRRVDLENARRRKPNLQTVEFIWLVSVVGIVKADEDPFKDVRARRAMALAGNPQEMMEANPFAAGQGALNPAVPAALREWSIPIDQLPPDGRRFYQQDIPEAKRLLAEAGFPNGLKIPVESTGSWGPDFLDLVQVMVKNWKAAGIDADLKLKGGWRLHRKVPSAASSRRPRSPCAAALPHPTRIWSPAICRASPSISGRGERPEAQRDDQAPAANLRRGPAAGDRLRHSALPLAAGVLPLHEPVGKGHRRVGTVREELHAEHRQRLRRSPDGGLARSVGRY